MTRVVCLPLLSEENFFLLRRENWRPPPLLVKFPFFPLTILVPLDQDLKDDFFFVDVPWQDKKVIFKLFFALPVSGWDVLPGYFFGIEENPFFPLFLVSKVLPLASFSLKV